MVDSQLNWARVAEKVGDIKRSLAELRRHDERTYEEPPADEGAVPVTRCTFMVSSKRQRTPPGTSRRPAAQGGRRSCRQFLHVGHLMVKNH